MYFKHEQVDTLRAWWLNNTSSHTKKETCHPSQWEKKKGCELDTMIDPFQHPLCCLLVPGEVGEGSDPFSHLLEVRQWVTYGQRGVPESHDEKVWISSGC